MLQLKGIYKTFNAGTVNEKRAIDNLNLTLEDGDFVTIIGGNGAGKSTTLNLIAGVYPVDAGMIHLNGYDLTNLPEHKRARFLGRVFQDPMMVLPLPWVSRRIWRWHTAAVRSAASAPALRTRNASCTAKSWQRSVWDWRTA